MPFTFNFFYIQIAYVTYTVVTDWNVGGLESKVMFAWIEDVVGIIMNRTCPSDALVICKFTPSFCIDFNLTF